MDTNSLLIFFISFFYEAGKIRNLVTSVSIIYKRSSEYRIFLLVDSYLRVGVASLLAHFVQDDVDGGEVHTTYRRSQAL